MKKNVQFWLAYSAAWLAYAASLGGVFLFQGSRFNANLLLIIAANVAPAVGLGVMVYRLCYRLNRNASRRLPLMLGHLLLAVAFAAGWGALNLLLLSVISSLARGSWQFVRWGGYALQWQFFSGLMAYFTIACTVYLRRANERLQEEERRSAELEMRAARAEAAHSRAELAVLRAQLNPHFLFNTLHSLMTLVRADPAAAEDALERFAALLRYVLQAQQTAPTDVTLADEWNFIQSYLELERLRLGARLKVSSAIDEAVLNFRLPAFVLQPIVENAIKHAIAPRTAGGSLHISARMEEGEFHIEVCDDGDGLSTKSLSETQGFGLRLVRESLAARFGAAARLLTETRADGGFRVAIILPAADPSGTAEAVGQTRKNPTERRDAWSYAR